MAILSKVGVEVRPAAFTALSHVVTVEKHLRGELRHILSILDFEFGLHRLSEGEGVAGAACLLVSESSSEVVALDVSPVKLLW